MANRCGVIYNVWVFYGQMIRLSSGPGNPNGVGIAEWVWDPVAGKMD